MVTESLKQLLAKEIDEARECYNNPPPNEASTCDWIILPLLHAVEYSKKDIVSQLGNSGNQYPDYTVLPDTPNTWYLEAKDWKQSLDKGPEATQALNYANAHGHRWVVLSNGKEWILFDNHIQGVQADKRIVARSEINDPGFTDFILALSKTSVQSGGLEEYAATWRLREVMRQQLVTKDSPVVKAIQKALKNEIGLSAIQALDIVRYFGEIREVSTDAHKPKETKIPLYNSLPNVKSLAELLEMGNELWNSKPEELSLPDGTVVSVNNWRDVTYEVVTWIGNASKLPTIPFRGTKNGKRWFLNTSPVHSDGKSMVFRQILVNNQNIFMDVHLSSSSLINALSHLCDSCNIDKNVITIRLMSLQDRVNGSDCIGSQVKYNYRRTVCIVCEYLQPISQFHFFAPFANSASFAIYFSIILPSSTLAFS
jgi:predicted type IV restriction endonuclease